MWVGVRQVGGVGRGQTNGGCVEGSGKWRCVKGSGKCRIHEGVRQMEIICQITDNDELI